MLSASDVIDTLRVKLWHMRYSEVNLPGCNTITFSRGHIKNSFLIFSRSQVLIFHSDCLHSLHEMLNPVSGKNKKSIINLSSTEFARRVVMVKGFKYSLKVICEIKLQVPALV